MAKKCHKIIVELLLIENPFQMYYEVVLGALKYMHYF